jgi:hypothetical protein
MQLICPECLGALECQDDQSARCTIHGGSYQILFARVPVPSLVAVDKTRCRQHPHLAAPFVCQHCGQAICDLCAFRDETGGTSCPECAPQHGATGSSHPAAADVKAMESVSPDARCVQHPHLAAVQQCKLCEAFMCATCDFILPGNVHLCPACAAAPRAALSPKRKKMLIASYALAVWSTVGMAALFAGVFGGMVQSEADQQGLGLILLLFVLGPAIVGMALGLSTKDRRLANPPVLWIAIVWNTIIVGSFLLLVVIGVTRGST